MKFHWKFSILLASIFLNEAVCAIIFLKANDYQSVCFDFLIWNFLIIQEFQKAFEHHVYTLPHVSSF